MNLGQPLFGRKLCDPERKKELRKKNNAKNSGQYVFAATPMAAHALLSDQLPEIGRQF